MHGTLLRHLISFAVLCFVYLFAVHDASEDDKRVATAEFIHVNVTDAEWTTESTNSTSSSQTESPSLSSSSSSSPSEGQPSLAASLFQSGHNSSRHKRDLPNIRTIETAIFVDQYLNQRFHGRLADLKRLVMATMNEVQLIYNYRTMKTQIKIVIVKFEVLQGAEYGPDNAGGDIDKYLDNFCSWQARKFRSATADAKWDHALMLTGLDLYKESGGKRNKKVLGLAWVNGMCKPTYSCTLNEGKSFEAAFVIAHEMGHSLGILHDGRGNNCDHDKYIMSEKTGPGKVNWSPCSNRYIENFLARGNGKCLLNSATPIAELDFQRTSRLPGEQYTPDIQCQLALGSQYKAYLSTKEPFNNVCRELWCLSGSWATPAHPALEGSSCGKNGEKCYEGSCVTGDERATLGTRRPSAGSNTGASIINRRSVTPSSNPNRNSNQGKVLFPRIRLQPQRAQPTGSQVRLGFGFGVLNRRRNNGNTGGLGHIPPIFLTTPPSAFSQIASVGPAAYLASSTAPQNPSLSARALTVSIPKQNSGGSAPTASTVMIATPATPKPLIEKAKGFLRTLLPEANRLFNLFSF